MRKLKLHELNRTNVADYKEQAKIPLYIVLDNVRSGHNVGAAFRTADCLGVAELILIGITPTPPHKEITKSAIGATSSVDWKHFKTVEEAVSYLQEKELRLVAIEQTDESVHLEDYTIDPSVGFAMIMGNEVSGVSDSFLEHIDAAIEIPQYGTKHSFNVSVCTGIVAYNFARVLRK